MDIDPIPVSLQGRIINNAVKSVLTAVFSLLEVLPFCATVLINESAFPFNLECSQV